MAYCRFGNNSDVYVFCGSRYEIHVAGGSEMYAYETPLETYNKLTELKNRGVKVPRQCLSSLKSDIVKNDHLDRRGALK